MPGIFGSDKSHEKCGGCLDCMQLESCSDTPDLGSQTCPELIYDPGRKQQYMNAAGPRSAMPLIIAADYKF